MYKEKYYKGGMIVMEDTLIPTFTLCLAKVLVQRISGTLESDRRIPTHQAGTL
jgi:hypothetical protein